MSKHAYNLLKKEKIGDESFSKVIERILSKKDNPWRLMQNKFDPDSGEGVKDDIRRIREKNLTGNEDND
ncbi:MAG: antitoxin VapB family protein [Promethearchaeota archaeon]